MCVYPHTYNLHIIINHNFMYTNQHKPNTNIGECQLQTSLPLLGLCILLIKYVATASL